MNDIFCPSPTEVFSFLCRKVNIMDEMIQKLERYANNLEVIVERRTEQLAAEQKKSDALLYRMLPA